jgi:hypothetical protein
MRSMRSAGRLLVVAAAALLTALPAAALPPHARPPAGRSAPPTAGTDLLRNAKGQSARYTGIGQLKGGLTCTAWLLDLPGRGTAYAVANGHCTDLSPSTTIVDAEPRGATIEFHRFVDTPGARLVVQVKRIAWSSMKGVDVGIFELDRTLAQLRAKGIRPLAIAAEPPTAGRRVESVGIPVVGVPQTAQHLRRSRCTTGAVTKRLVEERWVWYDAIPSSCRGITGGSSGSPLLDRATGKVLGAINTTTFLGERLTPCYSGRPCELRGTSLRARRATTYAIPVSALRACFTSAGRFRLGGACPLDARSWLTPVVPSIGVNPDVVEPFTGTPQTTWSVRLQGTGLSHYRTKVGDAGTTDCRVASGYGAPVALARAPVFDAPLPRAGGRHVLCLLAGPGPTVDARWQPVAHATTVVRYVDRVPPARQLEVVVREAAAGSTFEPIFDLPEQADFAVKVGSAATTDCSSPDGYTRYRRQPVSVEPSTYPARACVRSWDEAGNEPLPAWERLIDGVP